MSTIEGETLTGQLDDLLATGRQMLAGARDGDWDRAVTHQGNCHSLAEALFARPVAAADAAAIADVIGQLMEFHREVMALCTGSRDTFIHDIENLNQGRQAVGKYTANSG